MKRQKDVWYEWETHMEHEGTPAPYQPHRNDPYCGDGRKCPCACACACDHVERITADYEGMRLLALTEEAAAKKYKAEVERLRALLENELGLERAHTLLEQQGAK